MTVDADQIGAVVAKPTKNFFVHMLTRDIELQDALLDLLDNCVDGIVRSGAANVEPMPPYKGFFAKITMEPDYFIIEDNCGGIPVDIAKKYAFAIGKPAGAEGEGTSATVGMYGIGMKRAIFKLGYEALVESKHDVGFVVEFTPEWMESDSWEDLPMYDLDRPELKNGTRIEVHSLNKEVGAAFSDTLWIDDFKKLVAKQYALIIEKGFSVTIGTAQELIDGAAPIMPERFRLLETIGQDGARIAPFVYSGTCGGVEVEIFAGLYRELLTAEDSEVEEETRGASDDAGWTIACNDRVVVWKDKSRLTGWGEATVPNYHGQFIAITGIVLMRSEDPALLPLTTTKRGIDGSSNVYSEVKDMMREATKALTSFTNRWRKFPSQAKILYRGAKYLELTHLRESVRTLPMAASRKYKGIRKYEPTYPSPVQEKDSVRVSFVALKKDVAIVSEVFFGDEKVKPGDVGEAAFNGILEQLVKKEGVE